MTPDPRWAGVQGGITRPKHDPPGTYRITIEATGSTSHTACISIVVSDQQQARAYEPLLPTILDDMVAQLDQLIHA